MINLLLATLSCFALHAEDKPAQGRYPATDLNVFAREFAAWGDADEKSILKKANVCIATIDTRQLQGIRNPVDMVTVNCTPAGLNGKVDTWEIGHIAGTKPGEVQAYVMSLFVGERKFKFTAATAQSIPGTVTTTIQDNRTTLYFQK